MEIKRASIGDFDRIQQFTEAFTDKIRTSDEWQWEFMCSFLVPSIYMFASNEAGKVLGTQALMPAVIISGENSFITAKSEDTLVHPESRGRGLFSSIYEEVFKEAINDGIKLIWGFTGSKKSFASLGFHIYEKGLQTYIYINSYLATCKYYSKGIHGGFFKKLIKRIVIYSALLLINVISRFSGLLINSRNNDYTVKKLVRFDNLTDSLCKHLIKQKPDLITINRDAAYMRWRIKDNPYYKHEILGLYYHNELVGYLVLGQAVNNLEMVVADLLVLPDHINLGMPILLQTAIGLSKDSKASHIVFGVMPSSNSYTQAVITNLMKSQFFRWIGTMPFILKDLSNDEHNNLMNVNNWYINTLMTEGISRKDRPQGV